MLRNKSIIEQDNFNLPYLPKDFHVKLNDLEIKLEQGTLIHDELKELFDCYSTASSYYEAMDMHEEFKIYIKKMQDLLKNEKIQPLLKKRDSNKLKEKIEITVQEKREKIEKIKNLIKDTNTKENVKEATTNLIESFQKKEDHNKDLISKDIAGQEENFKKRLQEKKLCRTNSQPHMNFKSNKLKKSIDFSIAKLLSTELNLKFENDNLLPQNSKEEKKEEDKKNDAMTIENNQPSLAYRKRSSIRSSQSPVKRKSRLESHEDMILAAKLTKINTSKKSSLELDFNKENIRKISYNEKNVPLTQENLNEIFDEEYNDKITENLNEIWENAERKMEEELEKIQNEIEKFMEEIMEEKLQKTLEINQKYEVELKDLEADIDLNDETNVNTMIYNDIKKDREKEKQEFYIDLEIRKKNGLAELKKKSLNIKSIFQKSQEIEKIKSNIAKNIKNKILKSLTPKDSINKKFDFNNVNLNDPKDIGEDNQENEDEFKDEVKETDINLNRGLKRFNTSNIVFKKSINLTKRISKGYIGDIPIKENEKDD